MFNNTVVKPNPNSPRGAGLAVKSSIVTNFLFYSIISYPKGFYLPQLYYITPIYSYSNGSVLIILPEWMCHPDPHPSPGLGVSFS